MDQTQCIRGYYWIWTGHSVLEVIIGYVIDKIHGNNRVEAKHMSNVLESVQQLHVTVRLFSSVSYELYVLCKDVL